MASRHRVSMRCWPFGPLVGRAAVCEHRPHPGWLRVLRMEGTVPVSALRVVIGEDDVLMRAGLARLLADAGLDVVAEAGDAPDLLRKALAHRPDVAICDVQMPPDRQEDGLLTAIELRRRRPELAVLVLSQYHEPSYALRLIGDRPDGVGYLLKERVGRVASFVEAVERVAAGGSALDPVVVARMLKRQQRDDALGRLTSRER